MGRFVLRTLVMLVGYAACALAVGWGALAFPFLGGIGPLVVAELLLAAVPITYFAALGAFRLAGRKGPPDLPGRKRPPMDLRVAVALGLAAVVLAASWRVVREVIPAGVGPRSWQAYLTWSYDRNDIVSPDGRHRVMFRTNDAGAMRSGNCWTWAMARNPLFGKRVVAEGYTPEFWDGPFRMYRWNADGSLTIDFLAGHQSRETDLAPVTVAPAELD